MPAMKVAKTNREEINALYSVLNELEWLHKELQRGEFQDVDWENFEILPKLGLVKDRGLDLEVDRTPEYFLEDLLRHISSIHFQRILTNLEVLLDNCADPDQHALEFKPNIAKGLELLQVWVDAEPARKRDFPPLKVLHADLKRIGDSIYSSQCPECTPGTLIMSRDPATNLLLQEDACLYCGQQVVYTDVVDGRLVEVEN